MNKRIKELAELSIKESGQEFWWSTNDLVIEKFAELIVKECVDFLKDTLDDHFAAEQLEEHFRIKDEDA